MVQTCEDPLEMHAKKTAHLGGLTYGASSQKTESAKF